MIITKQRIVLVSVLVGVTAALIGCELAVDFDRSKIPVEGSDAGPVDASEPFDGTIPEGGGQTDASEDSSTTDASDAGSDTGSTADADDGSSDASDDAPDGDM